MSDDPEKTGKVIDLAQIAAEARQRAADLQGFDLTEDGIAQAFAAAFGGNLRYDHTAGKWYRWAGTHWQQEQRKLAYHWARLTCRKFAKELAAQGKKPGQIGKAATAAGVERFAQADPVFAVTSEIWDSDPWLLGTPGGTVDLRTGELRPAKREDFITRVTTVAPAETAACPLWLAFLADLTQEHDEYRSATDYLQRWFGYCLTGITREHALLFVFGDGGNGKGVLLNTVGRVMGGYATTAAMDTFTVTRGDKHPTDMAMLAGARLVFCTEVEEGQTWAEARVKLLTGGDPVTARFMRRDFFTFEPQFKLTVSGNHQPELRNVDAAAERRMNFLGALFKPPVPDLLLPEKLKSEDAGILRWLIDGCVSWQRDGLQPPEIVRLATKKYFEEQNVFAAWLEERCELIPSLQTRPGALLGDFNVWANNNGVRNANRSQFRTWLHKIRVVSYRRIHGSDWAVGIGFKPETP